MGQCARGLRSEPVRAALHQGAEDRESGPYTHLLLSVENASDQTFTATKWSCAFPDGEEPVHEEENLVRNVPARGRAVRRIIQNYGGPFDKIECRFMAAQEERP